MTAAERPSMQAIGWGSGDVAENADWARELAAEYDQRMLCRVDCHPSRTNDGTRLLWTVYALDDDLRALAPTPPTEEADQ